MPELYPEDQLKVDRYLTSNVNEIERAPFRVWRLLGVIFCVLAGLTLISYLVARNHGLV